MRDYAELCDLAESEIDDLARAGITPTAQEIVRINYLCWQVLTPDTRMMLSRGKPVMVGGVTLWPLTVAASVWFRDVALTLPDHLQPYALAYAMAYGRSSGTELDLAGDAARKAVKAFRRGLRCTQEELNEAVSQLIAQGESIEPPPRNKDETQPDATEESLPLFLAATCGGAPEMWERQCSMSYVLTMVKTVVAQNAADGKPTAGDDRIAATRALGLYTEEIRARHAKENA